MTSSGPRCSCNTVEYITPPRYIDLVKGVMGRIDLDPASSELANSKVVQAGEYYGLPTDGLSMPWYGRVFCNPPYGKRCHREDCEHGGPWNKGACPYHGHSNQFLWSQRMMFAWLDKEIECGILLVNAETSAKWFEPLIKAFPCCLTNHRIKYLNQDLEPQGSPGHGNAFFFFGPWQKSLMFQHQFRTVGTVIMPSWEERYDALWEACIDVGVEPDVMRLMKERGWC